MTPWQTLSGRVTEDLPGEVRRLLAHDAVLHIGTDSKTIGLQTHFVTVVAVLQPGRGGRAFHRSTKTSRSASLATQLINEVQLSIEAAMEFCDVARETIVLHIDANVEERHRSSKYAPMLSGMGLGNGFKVQLKPHAWCASCVADYVVRGRHQRVA
ncbi:MAG: ribonuclease H-like YkuK family protein [Planctomycetota bacterium]|nr:ribonuclease H-like YkuK family protein [Planctomycetota bacterium]